MRVAVLGAGNIGHSLGRAWAGAGQEVTFGVRDPERKRAGLAASIPNAEIRVDTVPAAIARGEAILFAVPAKAVEAIVQANAAQLDGKLLIDATNNFAAAPMSSVATLIQHAPNAKVFRAFNCLGWENFAQPGFGSEAADLFYCGVPNGHAQRTVEELISQVGLRPIRVGDLSADPLLDAILRIWIGLSQARGRHLAFKMLHD